MFPQLVTVAGDDHGLAGQRGGVAQLPFEVGAVGDEHDFEPAQVRMAAHRPDEEHHRQALADPWVCHMIPPLRSTWPSAGRVSPSMSRRSARCTPRYCW